LVTRQAVFGSFSSAFRRRFWPSLVRWNQNFSTSAPSLTSMASKRLIWSMRASMSALLMPPSRRSWIGLEYHDPANTPMRPLGGSARQ
jgi:hypothetical protein